MLPAVKRVHWQWIGLAVLLGACASRLPSNVFAYSSHIISAADKKGKDKKKSQQEKEDKDKKEKAAKKSDAAKSANKSTDKKAAATVKPAAPNTTARTNPPASVPPVVNDSAFPVNVPEIKATPTPAPPLPTEEKAASEKAADEKTDPNKDKDAPKDAIDSANTFKFNSSLVAVPVSVIDANGDPVKNLKAEEFILDEEGEKQQVQSLGEPGQTPLELTLLFDISGSVFERFEFQKQAAARFLEQVLKPNDVVSVFLVGFEGKLAIPRTRNFPKVKSEMMALQPSKEATAFYASVVRAAQYLNDNAETGSRRVMVVISDGEDNFSKTVALSDAARELQRSDMVFYSINPSGPSIKLNRISMRGQNAMLSLANDTGGVAFVPDREEELPRVFKQIAAELNAQYLLGYYSSNETNDGKFRRIKVQLPRHQVLRVRARQGYYAPKE